MIGRPEVEPRTRRPGKGVRLDIRFPFRSIHASVPSMPRKQKRSGIQPLAPRRRVHVAAFPDMGTLTAGWRRSLGTGQRFGACGDGWIDAA
jgi:hypothetical protein